MARHFSFISGTDNLKAEWSSNNIGGEWGHWLSIVSLDDSGKNWNGTWGALLRKESKDSDLGKTSVVDLGTKTRLLLLLGHVLGELEWVVQVEWNWVWDSLWSSHEVWVVAWLSTGHVVLVGRSGQFRPELKEGNNPEDLPLGGIGDGVPERRWVGLSWEGSSVHLHGPWELDSVGMHNVSDESEHSNTPVLDLSMTEESDGGLVGGTPELSLGEVEWIVESNNWVQLLSQDLKVSL